MTRASWRLPALLLAVVLLIVVGMALWIAWVADARWAAMERRVR